VVLVHIISIRGDVFSENPSGADNQQETLKLRDPQRLYARLAASDSPLVAMKIQSDPCGDTGS
jgi:hypothetical protein